jgi:hypothetical protein
LQKEGSQGLDTGGIDILKKTAERRSVRQLATFKQGHDQIGKRGKTCVECLQGSFSADRITQEHTHKIDHFVETKAPTSQSKLLVDGLVEATFLHALRDYHDFSQPRWLGRNLHGRKLDGY